MFPDGVISHNREKAEVLPSCKALQTKNHLVTQTGRASPWTNRCLLTSLVRRKHFSRVCVLFTIPRLFTLRYSAVASSRPGIFGDKNCTGKVPALQVSSTHHSLYRNSKGGPSAPSAGVSEPSLHRVWQVCPCSLASCPGTTQALWLHPKRGC